MVADRAARLDSDCKFTIAITAVSVGKTISISNCYAPIITASGTA